jgi:hypothetical protein
LYENKERRKNNIMSEKSRTKNINISLPIEIVDRIEAMRHYEWNGMKFKSSLSHVTRIIITNYFENLDEEQIRNKVISTNRVCD